MNRGVKRHTLFEDRLDYLNFLALMTRAHARVPLCLIAYCLMPNHWHLVVRPTTEHEVSAYLQWLTGTHSFHFNRARGTDGHVYQGRFKCVPVRDERQLFAVLRYVEGNALTARLVRRAEQWRWCSVHPHAGIGLDLTAYRRPDRWLAFLNETLQPRP